MGKIRGWNENGYCLDIAMLDGEEIEEIWDDGERLFIKSNLDRMWMSTETRNAHMENLDMIEITTIREG